MATVSFLFKPEATHDQRRHALAEIKHWAGVAEAGFLKEDAKNPEVRRMGWADVANPSLLEEVLARFTKHSAVESAGQPAKRSLVQPKPPQS